MEEPRGGDGFCSLQVVGTFDGYSARGMACKIRALVRSEASVKAAYLSL